MLTRLIASAGLAAALTGAAMAQAALTASAPVHSLDAPEARQGVASDGTYAYAIENSRIGKYELGGKTRVAAWEGESALFPHMNACTLVEKRLYCAASNYPKVPMTSAIEIFDPAGMTHLSTISLGMGHGSLTWVSRRDGFWWAGFANYDGRGGEPGRDHRYTMVVKFDAQWREVGGYALPDTVLDRMAPMSTSGGAWGDDGLLYVTGHDRPELYALRVPAAGSVLELVATIAIPFEGQAIDWDPKARRLLWGISRKDRKAIAVTVPQVPNVAR
jgi:hypothetical protein